MARHLSVIVILAVATFLGISFLMSFGGRADPSPNVFQAPVDSYSGGVPNEAKAPIKPVEPMLEGSTESKLAGLEITSELLTGDVIAPKLENATAKYVSEIAPPNALSPANLGDSQLTADLTGPNSVALHGKSSTR